jgi:hypothetical protein
MRNKNKIKSKYSKKNNKEDEIAKLAKQIKQLKTKEKKIVKQFTPEGGSSAWKAVQGLGSTLFHGGNAVSQYFTGSKIFGEGAYSMDNTRWDTTNQVPFMHSTNESVIFRHREYIGDIVATVDAYQNLYELDVNPGISDTFPYLARIASSFQEYRFRGLVFEYKTQSGMLTGGNTALGDVILVAQYRADAASPINKVIALNEMWSTSAVPSESAFLPIECSPRENPMAIQYIRTGPLGANQDQKLYDLCSVTVATVGTPHNFLGELWVTYEVELFKPVMPISSGSTPFVGTAALYTVAAPTTAENMHLALEAYDDIGISTEPGGIVLPCLPGEVYEIITYATATTSVTYAAPTVVAGTVTLGGALTGGSGTVQMNSVQRVTVLTTELISTPGGPIHGVWLEFNNVFVLGTYLQLLVAALPSLIP